MRCEYIKSNGEQCKATAIEDEGYCTIHLKMVADQEAYPGIDPSDAVVSAVLEEVLEEAPAEKGDDAVATVINKTAPRRVRYTGKGTYSVPSIGITFSQVGQEEEVPYWFWERIHENAESSKVFEEA